MPRKPKPPPKPERRRRGTGSISTAADGTIRARLPASVDPKRTAKEFPPGHLAEAHAWLDAHLNPQAIPESAVSPTLRNWSGQWYDTYVAPIRPPNTARAYLHALRQLEPLYAMPIDRLRASDLQARVAVLAERVAPTTLQGVTGVWRQCLEAAVDDGLLLRNPGRRLSLPAIPPPTPARHVTAAEVAVLWPAIRGARFEAAYAIILGCGLRLGEVLGLHWSSVDWERHRLWIQDQYTNGHWRPLPKARNPHWVPLPEEVAAALRRQRDRQPDTYTLVFQSPYRGKVSKHDPNPRPWSRPLVGAELSAIVKRVGLDPMTPHAGRHGLATLLLENGVPAPVIAERLGNTPLMILNVYSHTSVAGIERANRIVDQYLGQPISNDVSPTFAGDDDRDDRGVDAVASR